MTYRTALVTGASRGIGRALAEELANRGTFVYLLARDPEALADATSAIRAKGGQAESLVHDVSDAHATARLVRTLDARANGLDLVIANAGVGLPSTEVSPYAWESIAPAFETNVLGAVATLTAALPAMVARGRGHVVATGSLASFGAVPRGAAYSAPKASIDMLLDCLRIDLAGSGVAATNLRLGFVRTRMLAREHPMPQMMEPEEVARIVVERLPEHPREIVLPAAFGAAVRAFGSLPASVRERFWTRFGRAILRDDP
jgi:short-subunit dehydrogenase